MISKPRKDHQILENHRPISLLNSMSKILEKFILYHLKKHTKIRPEQHAFHEGYSTTTQLITLVDELTRKNTKGKKLPRFFLT